MHHTLKIWPRYFDRVISGEKTFEVRKNDRDFQNGDTIRLREYDPGLVVMPAPAAPGMPPQTGGHSGYTGREATLEVGYVLVGGSMLPADVVVFSIRVTDTHLPDAEGLL